MKTLLMLKLERMFLITFIISLTEDMPTTRDKVVLSKEELDNEREEKGGVTKRSTFFLRRGQH